MNSPVALGGEGDPGAVAASHVVGGPEGGCALEGQRHKGGRVRGVARDEVLGLLGRLVGRQLAGNPHRGVGKGELEVLRGGDVGAGAAGDRAHVAGDELVPAWTSAFQSNPIRKQDNLKKKSGRSRHNSHVQC